MTEDIDLIRVTPDFLWTLIMNHIPVLKGA